MFHFAKWLMPLSVIVKIETLLAHYFLSFTCQRNTLSLWFVLREGEAAKRKRARRRSVVAKATSVCDLGRKFTHVCPLCQRLGVLVPRYLHANRVTLHPIEVRVLRRGAVEELAPEKLAVQRQRRHRFLYLKEASLSRCLKKLSARQSPTERKRKAVCIIIKLRDITESKGNPGASDRSKNHESLPRIIRVKTKNNERCNVSKKRRRDSSPSLSEEHLYYFPRGFAESAKPSPNRPRK